MPLEVLLLRRARAGAVETVIVGGGTVLHRGRFVDLDRDAVLDAIARSLDHLVAPGEAARRDLAWSVLRVVRAFYGDWTWRPLG